MKHWIYIFEIIEERSKQGFWVTDNCEPKTVAWWKHLVCIGWPFKMLWQYFRFFFISQWFHHCFWKRNCIFENETTIFWNCKGLVMVFTIPKRHFYLFEIDYFAFRSKALELPKLQSLTYLKTMFSITEDAVLCVFKKKNLFLGTQFGGGAS